MKIESKTDLTELKKACEVTSEFITNSDFGIKKSGLLFDSLCLHTIDYISEEVPRKKSRLTAVEIMKREDPAAEEKGSDLARKAVKSLEKDIESFYAEEGSKLDQRLRAMGCKHRVVLGKTESKGRNPAEYYLEFDTGAAAEGKTDEGQARASGKNVTYHLTDFEAPSAWAKPFMSIDLDGWRLKLYFFIPIIGYLIAVLWPAWIFFGSNYDQILFYILYLALGYFVWLLIGAAYLLIDSRVVIAPGWMVHWHTRSAVLEMVPTEKMRDSGRPVRRLRIVSYSAQCPVCSAEVCIVKGKREFKDRLIGQCCEAGAEHLFSFDHVTKKGVPLRSNAYYGEAGIS